MKKSFERIARTISNYYLTAEDEYLGVGQRSGPITVFLPSKTAVRPDYSFFIKDESRQAAAFPITIQAQGGEEIESSSSYVMNVNGGSIEVSNNSERFLVLSSHSAAILPPSAGGTGEDSLGDLATALDISTLYKLPVRVATTGNIADLASGAPFYIDSVILTENDRVLVWKQDDETENGIYRLAVVGTGSDGTLVRADDCMSNDQVSAGLIVIVNDGITFNDRMFLLSYPDDEVDIGTTPLFFAPLAGVYDIRDDEGNKILELVKHTGATQFLSVENAAGTGFGSHPSLKAAGANANVSLYLLAKGSGAVISQYTFVKRTGTATLSTASDQLLTATQLVEGILVRTPNGGPRTDSLPTAVSFVNAIPGAVGNTSFEFTIINASNIDPFDFDESITLAGNAGITIVGDGIIEQGKARRFVGVVTGFMPSSEAVTIYCL